MAYDLDATDHQILGILLKDGRAPAAQIAEEVGLSRPSVAERIEKMERSGVIRGTTVVIEPSALGKTITAFIAARGPMLSTKGWNTFRQLMQGEEVLEVHTVAGEDCFLIKVRTGSVPALNALVNRLAAPPLSLATRTTIAMETHCEKVGGIILGDD